MKYINNFYGIATTGAGARLKNTKLFKENLYNDKIINRYKSSIRKDLKNLNIIKNEVPNNKLRILDVGAGKQTLAFSKIFNCTVDHFDISIKHVSELKKYLNKKKLKNIITSTRADLVKYKSFKKNFYDLIYLQGIIQHLSKPEIALKKIFKSIKPKGYAWLYFYKSGSYLNFINYLLRDLFHNKNNGLILNKNLNNKIEIFKNKLSKKELYIYDIFVDSLFTPYSYDFDYKKILKAFNDSNFDIIGKKDCNTGINNYNHLCKHSAFIISIRKKNNSNLKVNYKLLSNFSSVNQLKLKYKDKKIKQIIKEQKKLKKIFQIKNYNFDKKMYVCYQIFKSGFLKNIKKKELYKKYDEIINKINFFIQNEK